MPKGEDDAKTGPRRLYRLITIYITTQRKNPDGSLVLHMRSHQAPDSCSLNRCWGADVAGVPGLGS